MSILIVTIILVFTFKHFFETPENIHKEFIARQKFIGIVQKNTMILFLKNSK